MKKLKMGLVVVSVAIIAIVVYSLHPMLNKVSSVTGMQISITNNAGKEFTYKNDFSSNMNFTVSNITLNSLNILIVVNKSLFRLAEFPTGVSKTMGVQVIYWKPANETYGGDKAQFSPSNIEMNNLSTIGEFRFETSVTYQQMKDWITYLNKGSGNYDFQFTVVFDLPPMGGMQVSGTAYFIVSTQFLQDTGEINVQLIQTGSPWEY